MKTIRDSVPVTFRAPGAALFLLSLLAQAPGARAQDAPGGRPPGPPPEAVAACKGKSEGEEVRFTLRDGKTLGGICKRVDGQLAAQPAGQPPR